MKVLVVENDSQAREEIRDALILGNYDLMVEMIARGVSYSPLSPSDIELAASMELALHLLQSSRFDLVLLDLHLPEAEGAPLPPEDVLHGYKVLTAVHSQRPRPRVLIVSANVRVGKPGLSQFEDRMWVDDAPLPDDLLLKEDNYRNIALLQRKVASYLVLVSEEDRRRLWRSGIYFNPQLPGETGRLLQEMKQVTWRAEVGRPSPDLVLRGERGVGKSALAKAFHVLRFRRVRGVRERTRKLYFEFVDMPAVHRGTSDPVEFLCGTSGGDSWRLGALPRNSFYSRHEEWMPMPGQTVQEQAEGLDLRVYVVGGEPSSRMYPRSRDEVDFDASGTIYLEDAIGIDPKVDSEMERILSPDLDHRYVTTRGIRPLRLRVGPAVVLGFTTESADAVESPEQGSKAPYTPQVGQVLLNVPPLRERNPEEKVWFLEMFANQRRRRLGDPSMENPVDIDKVKGVVKLDENLREIVGRKMYFHRNFDDLQAIANRLLPEDETISWKHVLPLWERDKELARKWRERLKR